MSLIGYPSSQCETETTIVAGELVLIEEAPAGKKWWKVKSAAGSGWVPATYLAEDENTPPGAPPPREPSSPGSSNPAEKIRDEIRRSQREQEHIAAKIIADDRQRLRAVEGRERGKKLIHCFYIPPRPLLSSRGLVCTRCILNTGYVPLLASTTAMEVKLEEANLQILRLNQENAELKAENDELRCQLSAAARVASSSFEAGEGSWRAPKPPKRRSAPRQTPLQTAIGQGDESVITVVVTKRRAKLGLSFAKRQGWLVFIF